MESKDPVRRGSDVIIGEMITVQRSRSTGRITEHSDFLALQRSSEKRVASALKFDDEISSSVDFVAPLHLNQVDPQVSDAENMKCKDEESDDSKSVRTAVEVVRVPKVVVYDRSDPDFDDDEDYDEDGNLNDEDLDL